MTSDSVLRVFMPVIDAPTHLQLHAALDRWAFAGGEIDSSPAVAGEKDAGSAFSKRRANAPIFWLDRPAMLAGLPDSENDTVSEREQGRRRKLKEFVDEDWELFAFVSKYDSLTVRALSVREFPEYSERVLLD